MKDRSVFMIKKNHAYFVAIALTFLLVGFFINPLLFQPTSIQPLSNAGATSLSIEDSLTEPVSAEKIYKMFLCSCCDQTIDARCCGMAKDMVDYVDSQVDAGLSETDIIIQTVKKYGLNSLVESKQAEIKAEILRRAPADRPEIAIEPGSYDFGDVSQAKGTVSAFFTVKNDGKTDLIIDGLSTSCGCTTASLGGSPFFGMAGHGDELGPSPSDWSYKIPPGGTAELEVKYDPNMHPDFRGAATRIVYISSNDPVDFRKEVRIELNQVD